MPPYGRGTQLTLGSYESADTGLLHAASATLGATLKLQVQLPQIFNLRVNVLGNNVTAHDEIEGNVIIRSLNGNVSVRKVR